MLTRALSDPIGNKALMGALVRLEAHGVVKYADGMKEQLLDSAMREFKPEELVTRKSLKEQIDFAERAIVLIKMTLSEELVPGVLGEVDAPQEVPAGSAPTAQEFDYEGVWSRLPDAVKQDLANGGRETAT